MGETPRAYEKLTFVWVDDPADDYIRQVDFIIRDRGWKPLPEILSRVLCAIDKEAERVVGFHVLQLFPHCEPLWVSPEYAGSKLASELSDQMLEFMLQMGARGFMVVADNPHAAKLCESRGMKRVTSPVYLM